MCGWNVSVCLYVYPPLFCTQSVSVLAVFDDALSKSVVAAGFV